ncbi:TraR/DksA C4-type zinc finger protein [Herbiconiux sp.]|uniref:TraR/DksA family transcriptional regulator n=1 Tax=Herbiconiux sp. TaxID=1871186 RepID=UPI0025BA9C94|nr:TraR/DksA C4-type zinc finger protein [Herbiconiux sp.]
MAALTGEREAALAQIGELRASMAELRTVRESSPDDDEHDPEGPTLSSEWSRIRGLELAAARRLEATDAALARVAAGTYGLCLTCGLPIPVGRLEIRPAATHCVNCA